MNRISNFLNVAAMAAAMGQTTYSSGAGKRKERDVVGFTPKQWQKRKRKLKMQSDSRKVNR